MPESVDETVMFQSDSRARLGEIHGPDRVKYSDIKNLSVDNKSKLFRLYEESFATGQVPEDWSHSYLKPIPNRERTIASRTDTISSQCKTQRES